MIRVTALPSDTGACGFYRVMQPLRLLSQQGRIQLNVSQREDGRFQIGPGMDSDVLILQKPGGGSSAQDEERVGFLAEVSRLKCVVYEVDDDLENVPKENPVRPPKSMPGYIERTRKLISACRVVTCTTHTLAARLARHNPNTRVIPNGIDLDRWRASVGPKPAGERVRIVWAASQNHYEDARLLIHPFREIARRFDHVDFVLAGGRFPELERAIGQRLIYAGASSFSNLSAWPDFARSLDADIWVAPLLNSVFARSKSNLKFLEGTAVGAAVVASDVEPYSRGPGGEPWNSPPMFLVRNKEEWTAALSTLVQFPRTRADVAREALAVVEAHYTAQHTADAWLRVLEEVTR